MTARTVETYIAVVYHFHVMIINFAISAVWNASFIQNNSRSIVYPSTIFMYL